MTNQDGFAALWVAACLVFFMGATALAVDVSGFYETARADQTTADLACLAGIPEMPGDPSTARAAAAANAQSNFPALADVSVSTSGNVTTLDDGQGNRIVIEAPSGGDADKMRVEVTETDSATFGRVLGAGDVPITQEAYCKVFAKGGDALQPFGALPGGAFDGVLQDTNPCETGNCRALDIPRSDINGSGNQFIRNMSLGADRNLTTHKAPIPPWTGATVCSTATPTCNVLDLNQGVSAGPFSDGMARGGAGVDGRLEDTSSGDTFQSKGGRTLDGQSPLEILGPSMIVGASNFPAQPAAWDSDVHGTFPTAPNTGSHIYFNDGIRNCASPRFVKIPIIAELDWASGPANLPPGNSDPVKIIGFYDAIITDPNETSDFKNPSDVLKTANVQVVWFGPDAHCVGPTGSTLPYTTGSIKTWRLVDQAA